MCVLFVIAAAKRPWEPCLAHLAVTARKAGPTGSGSDVSRRGLAVHCVQRKACHSLQHVNTTNRWYLVQYSTVLWMNVNCEAEV